MSASRRKSTGKVYVKWLGTHAEYDERNAQRRKGKRVMIGNSDVRGELAELVYGFPPVRIENEAQLAATEARVDELTGRSRTPAEEMYLDLLGTRIHEWEEEHEQIPDIHGPDLIRVLLRERVQQQHDLVEAGVFATDSVASEVLSGRRPFRLEHILAVARFFDLPPAVFLPEPEVVHA